MKARLAVLASGAGTNLQAVLDACASARLPADVVTVVSDVPSAGALERAQRAGVEGLAVPPAPGEPRRAYDVRLAALVERSRPDWVVLAGWMRILTAGFLDRFPRRVVNLHPALPGELPGTRAIDRAFDEARAGRRTTSGVMVHLVPDEGVDDGPVIASASVQIRPDDSLAAFADRIHTTERELLVHALHTLIRQEIWQ